MESLDYLPAKLRKEIEKGYCPDFYVYNSLLEERLNEASFLGELEIFLKKKDISKAILTAEPPCFHLN